MLSQSDNDLPPINQLLQPPSEFHTLFRQQRPFLEVGGHGVLIALYYIAGIHPNPHTGCFNLNCNSYNGIPMEELEQRLGNVRDQWYQDDRNSWCQASPFYSGIEIALKHCLNKTKQPPQIITKKRRRFAEALLRFNGCSWDPQALFGFEDGSKEKRLLELKHKNPSAEILFFEDRLETLERIANNSELRSIRLFFCTWGYNTQEQVQRASQSKIINSINLTDFCSLIAS
jgi:hypothetical protein